MPAEDPIIRPFQVGFPDAELTELRRRVKATRWPERETVTDDSQGVPLAMMQELARYWATEYDWRQCEAKLNGLPHFMTEIDGLDIHFIRVRSAHEEALPLIVTHGWPGSIIEQLKIIGPLTNPTAHGASSADAFHLVIPSLPGYGFSAKPATTGWDPARTARSAGTFSSAPAAGTSATRPWRRATSARPGQGVPPSAGRLACMRSSARASTASRCMPPTCACRWWRSTPSRTFRAPTRSAAFR
jgi:hypothetical protein